MDARPTTADSKHHYPPKLLYCRSTSSPVVPRLHSVLSPTPPVSATTPLSPAVLSKSPHGCHPQIDLIPILFPQQSSLYQAQLLQYNKLIAPSRGRGGGTGGLQTPPLPPILSTPTIHIGGHRSTSKVSNKDKDSSRSKPGSQTCHGNRGVQNTTNKAGCAVITGKEPSASLSIPSPSNKMPQKPQARTTAAPSAPAPVVSNPNQNQKKQSNLPARPTAASTSPATLASVAPPTHSNSVPSTPHQHARKFSFESREPSPTANHGHSPRSAYSETNGNMPSLRPLPPRSGGCQYETIPERSRRRVPYSDGGDRLDRLDISKVQSKLGEDAEKKLSTDMEELYDRLKPTKEVEAKRGKLIQKLEKLLNDTWPGHDIRVRLFGSSGNLLCSDDSDVDICITTPWTELEGVCMLADLLAKHGFQKVVCVSSAKVPIVKAWDPEFQLACDMNVNNTLALENTRMIRTYIDIDDRVRPLAMIIKYWTRRRVMNDAAFGGTLSSYTWICMIIAFLQLRKPPVVPALHQQLQYRLPKKEGEPSAFADDVEKLRGIGAKNKSTLGELLFQFFRFYAHEFDYGEHALSVRSGKLMRKTEKKHWHLAINNSLCVEEPFNTMRNLGNTADDTSFRGIHLEIRRAFDLIAEGKLGECCEQYEFPKEEERIFQKPVSAPRPALLRSASQQNNRGGRGGNGRGGRQQGQYRNNNHGNNRRASSSTAFDNGANHMYFPGYQFVTQGDGMGYMSQDALAQTLSALQQQENNLRFLQYTQNQAFAQQQALAHAQRMQGGNTSQPQTSTERSRTNSIENPPLTAPLRPEMYYWPWQGQQFYAHPGFTTYPSSPSNGQSTEPRRSPHRTVATSETGAAASGSSLRSQSQPASRSLSVAQPIPGVPGVQPVVNGATSVGAVPSRHAKARPIPSFIPDETTDADANRTPTATHALPADDKGYGYYLDPNGSTRGPVALTNGMPAFGDLGPQGSNSGRRRLSSDQFPHNIFDRIQKRTSRSPSPLGHGRAYSVGTSPTPIASSTFPATANKPVPDGQPIVVNGSGYNPTAPTPKREQAVPTGMPQADGSFETPQQATQPRANGIPLQVQAPLTQPMPPSYTAPPNPERPLVVNGSSSASQPPSYVQAAPRFSGDVVTMTSDGTLGIAGYSAPDYKGPVMDPSAPFPRFAPRGPPSQLIAQLDLATGEKTPTTDLQHLSPVYETVTPSPTLTRRFDLPLHQAPAHTNAPAQSQDTKPETKAKPKPRAEVAPSKVEAAHSTNPRINGHARENGHAKGGKGENENGSGWQKMTKGRKKAAEGKSKQELYPQSEQPPKNDLERKGG
ncbi:Pap 25a associated domain family [Apiospora sp. TS-2023a]